MKAKKQPHEWKIVYRTADDLSSIFHCEEGGVQWQELCEGRKIDRILSDGSLRRYVMTRAWITDESTQGLGGDLLTHWAEFCELLES